MKRVQPGMEYPRICLVSGIKRDEIEVKSCYITSVILQVYHNASVMSRKKKELICELLVRLADDGFQAGLLCHIQETGQMAGTLRFALNLVCQTEPFVLSG